MSGQYLLSYYGDDFTGSTDVMEALSSNGIETVLFTRIPSEDEQARFTGFRAVGLAGTSRSQPPAWMDRHLPVAFEWLKSLGAEFCHYKVCSTFDSAPERGSIGRALEIGLSVFEQRQAGIVVGAPQLKRYTMFGHLFAGYAGQVYRVDRHPVMRHHPATPMAEADLRLHLTAQTALPVAVPDADGAALSGCEELQALLDGTHARAVLFDVHDAASQRRAGDMLAGMQALGNRFLVGSSGIEYALLAAGRLGVEGSREPARPLDAAERIAVVSGSCSPTTERQIRTACAAGFAGIALDFSDLADGDGEAFDKALREAGKALAEGRSPILYTALGAPVSTAIDPEANSTVGRTLGRLLDTLVKRHDLTRVAVAGGDTSSHALSELDTLALTLRKAIPASPGSPVCLGHFADGREPIELLLKGGQIGGERYFVDLRDGTI